MEFVIYKLTETVSTEMPGSNFHTLFSKNSFKIAGSASQENQLGSLFSENKSPYSGLSTRNHPPDKTRDTQPQSPLSNLSDAISWPNRAPTQGSYGKKKSSCLTLKNKHFHYSVVALASESVKNFPLEAFTELKRYPRSE